MAKPKRYFIKHTFLDGCGPPMEIDIGLEHYPVTENKAREILATVKAMAQRNEQDVTMEFWVEHGDGTRELILQDLPN